ncbi:MAG: hypothetical protein DRN95_06265, partial [Candidatus Hydrothermarchaeota archaeon]
VKPVELFLNWTNNYASNITITINESFNNITVEILNGTSSVIPNYSQINSLTYCQPGEYRLFIIDVNESNSYDNFIGPLNATNSSIATVIDNVGQYSHLQCKPGRYWVEKFTIRNKTQTNETANITVFIDIPISASNNANFLSTGIESFNGNFTPNATTYHSYYFNITELSNGTTNVTGVAINLSSSADTDLFLLDDSGNLKAKSINKSSNTEWLLHNFLPSSSAMWEIRVYGNSTSSISYTGYITFTGLNLLNSTNQRVSSIDLGVKNASETIQKNFILRNELNLSLSNVVEQKEVYYEKKFGGSGSNNFTFIVPSFASKVRVSMNWTGGSNYSFEVYNQSGILVGSSVNKHVYANITGVMEEEYDEISSIGSSAGLWRVEVRNNSVITDPYDVKVSIYVSPSSWIRSNYTSMTFNRSGESNSSTGIQINFTIPNNTMSGTYKGYIRYIDSNNAGIDIPFSVNVTTPMLVVNNTMNSMITRVDENYGANITRILNFILNNTGDYDLVINITNSSNVLSCVSGSCSGYHPTFIFNKITSITNHSSQTLNVNITFNSSMPKGLYEGWIFINATNSSISLSSHPYPTFNLTLRLNLTDLLDVRVFDIVSIDGNNIVENSTASENVTAKVRVYYINGTEIEAGNSLTTSNFSIWLINRNVSSYRIPTSGSLSSYNGTNPLYYPDYYNVNFTVPANKPGGFYDIHVNISYTRNVRFSGEGVNTSFLLNNTGLYMALVSYPSSLSNGTSGTVNVSIKNYGPVKALTPKIKLNKGSYISSVSYSSISSNCGVTGTPGEEVTISSINPNGTQVCYVAWTITAGSSEGTGTSTVNGTSGIWFNNLSFSTNVYVPSTTTTTTAASTSTSTTTTTTIPVEEAVYLNITDYPSLVEIEQGQNKSISVTVKNINDTISQTVSLTILNMSSNWYDVSPSSVLISYGDNYTFNITFKIPENASVMDYKGMFKAYSGYGSDFQRFTLRVIPGSKLQAEIVANLSSLKNEAKNLGKAINSSKAQGYNLTEVESLFNQLNSKINEALNYLNQSDYMSAYLLLDDIEDLLNKTKNALVEATTP